MPRPRRAVANVFPSRALLEQGLDEAHRGEYRALQTLAAAKERCRVADDRTGVALCAAARLLTGQIVLNFRTFPEDMDSLSELRDGPLRFDDPRDELLAYAGMLSGLLMVGPSDPMCDRCVDEIVRLLELDVDVNLKFAAGRAAMFYTEPREQRELGNRINALLDPLIDDRELTPHRLGRWLTFRLRVTPRDPDQYERVQRQARDLVQRTGDAHVVTWLAITDFDLALRRRDLAAAARARDTIAAASDPANLDGLRRREWIDGRLALARGEGDAALFHALRTRRYSEDFALPGPMLGVVIALEAQARAMTGDFDGARSRFAEAASMVAVLHAEEMRDQIRMVDAYEAHLAQRADARELLQRAFGECRARQFYDTFDGNPTFGATMCALALEHGVESEFVRRIIERNVLAPPRDAGRSWPWPVAIDSLGRFTVARRGKPIALQGKVQRRPLELAKLLVAQRRSLDKHRVVELLWPDTDAEPAALDMTIMRLRKLLGVPEAVVIEDGKVGLNPDCVWVDLWAFERAVDALVARLRTKADDDAIGVLADRVLELYQGSFLDHEQPHTWLLYARDRARSRFLRSVADVARQWEGRDRWPDAVALYERALEVDPLAEDVYRRLIHCHIARGQAADAARVFQRCREMLAAELGMAPSAETQALFDSLPRR
jgi:two-component SAPR family response regulator